MAYNSKKSKLYIFFQRLNLANLIIGQIDDSEKETVDAADAHQNKKRCMPTRKLPVDYITEHN